MFSIRTKGTDIARRIVHEAMPDHLVLTFEPLATFAAGAAWYRAVVWSILAVDIGMGAGISQ
jgi:hypothetical protein